MSVLRPIAAFFLAGCVAWLSKMLNKAWPNNPLSTAGTFLSGLAAIACAAWFLVACVLAALKVLSA